MLSCSELDTEQLDDAQTLQLKQAAAQERQYKEKLQKYQDLILEQRTDRSNTINSLKEQVRQYELEKVVEHDEKRAEVICREQKVSTQIDVAVNILKSHQGNIASTEEWLASLAYCKTDQEFKKIGHPICDAIVLPKCPLLFDPEQKPFKKMEAFFIEMNIPVGLVCQAVKFDCVFIQLEDTRNQFTCELIKDLQKAIEMLQQRTYAVLKEQGHTDDSPELKDQLQRIFIRQIDFTQDVSGFIMFSTSLNTPCVDLFDIIKDLGKIINMPYSREYNQLLTCAQYVDFNDSNQMVSRMKIYNKFEHLLTCGQFKKAVNMNIVKLLLPSTSFYQNKVQPALETGLSRIELSTYYNSYEDYQNMISDQNKCRNRINLALGAINQLRHKLYYKVPLELMLNSYFTFCQRQLIAFDEKIQIIVYSYNKRSCTFVGDINKKTRHSPSNLVFLKKYMTLSGTAAVFMQGKFIGSAYKTGQEMELPIHSINQLHEEKIQLIIQEQLLYNLKDTSRIEINTSDQQLAVYLKLKQNKDQQQLNEDKDLLSKQQDERQAKIVNQVIGKRGIQQTSAIIANESKTKKKREVKKRNEKECRKTVNKTKAGALIRAVKEDDWEQVGYCGVGKSRRKLFKCKKCKTSNVRSDHRNVHAC